MSIMTSRRSSSDKAGMWVGVWQMLAPDVAPGLEVQWVGEYEFMPGRKFRADWACVPEKIAVEVDGGNRKAAIRRRKDGGLYAVAVGSHTQDGDYWKRAHAASMGWLVFAFTPSMLETNPVDAVRLVAAAIRARREK